MAESVREKATRLSDGQRLTIRVSGIINTLAAIALIAFVFSRFLSLFTTRGPPPDEFTQQIPLMFGLFALGSVSMLIGTFLLRLGFLRPFSEIVATEAEGALQSAGGSLGRGWRGDKRSQQSSEIRIRCVNAGNWKKRPRSSARPAARHFESSRTRICATGPKPFSPGPLNRTHA